MAVESQLIRIVRRGPGCSIKPGTVIKMNRRQAARLIQRKMAVPYGANYTIEPEDTELSGHHPRVGADITSIIIPVYNQPYFLQRCVNSVLRYTPVGKYELIIVDNGSDQETKSVIQAAQPHRVITNDRNMGFPHAANQGILSSRGRRLLLLNSDTVVTPGWLDTMVKGLRGDIGMVGPTTNYSTGAQCIPSLQSREDWQKSTSGHAPDVSDKDIMALHEKFSASRDYRAVYRLSGFCLLVDRRVVSEIGFFDSKSFGLGNGEEMDFEDRAMRRGWKLAWAHGAYVHHFGHKTLVNVQRKDDMLRHAHIYQNFAKQRDAKTRGIVVPFFQRTPVMFPTWNRLAYTKQSIEALLQTDCDIMIYDDGSSDGTVEYLESLDGITARVYNPQRVGLDSNMDLFFSVTAGTTWIAKIDNDTIVKPDDISRLIAVAEDTRADILAPTHFSNHKAKDKYLTERKKRVIRGHTIFVNHHVGGLGVFRRSWITDALSRGQTAFFPQYGKTPGGWTRFQESTSGLIAFYPDIRIKLLDAGAGKSKPDDYPEYNASLRAERRKAYGRYPEPQ